MCKVRMVKSTKHIWKKFKNLYKFKDVTFWWKEKLNIIKMSILPKVTSRCYAIPIKFQAENLVEIKFDSKIICKGRESRMAKSIKKKQQQCLRVFTTWFYAI